MPTNPRSPTSIRLGRTFAWADNIALPNPRSSAHTGGDLSLVRGLDHASSALLLKYHELYTVKGSIRVSEKTKRLHYYLLFMPKMKQPYIQRQFKKLTDFMEERVLSTRPLNNETRKAVESQVMARRMHRSPSKGIFYRNNVNKWITYRMFRNSSPTTRRSVKNIPRKKINQIKTKLTIFIKRHRSVRKFYNPRFKFKLRLRKFKTRPHWQTHYRSGKRGTQVLRKDTLINMNDHNMSRQLSKISNRSVRVKTMNVFTYLAKKGLIRYHTHQEHMWGPYRRFRRRYSYYYYIVNSFFILTVIPKTERVLFSVLKQFIPYTKKLRRFFYFIDFLIKKMNAIRMHFRCFRFVIIGKMAGGSKRTKTLTIGYGEFPYQSTSANVFNNFMSFPHKFGAFGIKLFMWRIDWLTKLEREEAPLYNKWSHDKLPTIQGENIGSIVR